ncbi:oxidoreductase [Klebsiella pneumoniae]|nr:oxidoreductase [Klebsiella pneumoniae]
MKYVNLGRSGLKVSRLCLGCMSYGEPERLPQPWSLDEKASRPLIRQALEAGINFFDTANIYSGGSSEEITGKALREMARRDEIVVATKTFFPWRNSPNTGFLSRKAIFQSRKLAICHTPLTGSFPRFRIRRLPSRHLQRSRTINTLPWPGVAGSPRPLIPGH